MNYLFQILILGRSGKTSILAVKARNVMHARAAAVSYFSSGPSVVLTVVSEREL